MPVRTSHKIILRSSLNLKIYRRSWNEPCFVIPDADRLVDGACCNEWFANANVESSDFRRVKRLRQYFELTSISLHTTTFTLLLRHRFSIINANTELKLTRVRLSLLSVSVSVTVVV